MTASQIQGLPQYARDMHADLIKKVENTRQRLTEAKGRLETGTQSLEALGAEYEKAADEIEDFVRQLSNAPLGSSPELQDSGGEAKPNPTQAQEGQE